MDILLFSYDATLFGNFICSMQFYLHPNNPSYSNSAIPKGHRVNNRNNRTLTITVCLIETLQKQRTSQNKQENGLASGYGSHKYEVQGPLKWHERTFYLQGHLDADLSFMKLRNSHKLKLLNEVKLHLAIVFKAPLLPQGYKLNLHSLLTLLLTR